MQKSAQKMLNYILLNIKQQNLEYLIKIPKCMERILPKKYLFLSFETMSDD